MGGKLEVSVSSHLPSPQPPFFIIFFPLLGGRKDQRPFLEQAGRREKGEVAGAGRVHQVRPSSPGGSA